MSQILVPGIRLTTTRTVSGSDTAAIYGSGLHDVLSTPAMIALMEQTAMKAVEACLDEGEGTVGTEVNVKHLKATPVREDCHLHRNTAGGERQQVTVSRRGKR